MCPCMACDKKLLAGKEFLSEKYEIKNLFFFFNGIQEQNKLLLILACREIA